MIAPTEDFCPSWYTGLAPRVLQGFDKQKEPPWVVFSLFHSRAKRGYSQRGTWLGATAVMGAGLGTWSQGGFGCAAKQLAFIGPHRY